MKKGNNKTSEIQEVIELEEEIRDILYTAKGRRFRAEYCSNGQYRLRAGRENGREDCIEAEQRFNSLEEVREFIYDFLYNL